MTNTATVKLPKWRLPNAQAAILAAAGSLYRSATEVMAESKEKFVPVETGTLRTSGIVDPPQVTEGRVVVTLGYGGPAAPYALAVHENPRSGKTGGISPGGQKYRRWAKVGQWKYLSTPFEVLRPGFGAKVMKAIMMSRRPPV